MAAKDAKPVSEAHLKHALCYRPMTLDDVAYVLTVEHEVYPTRGLSAYYKTALRRVMIVGWH